MILASRNVALLARQGLAVLAQNQQNSTAVIAELARDLAAYEAQIADAEKPQAAPTGAAKE